MSNFLTEPEVDEEVRSYVLRQWIKESKKYKPTKPYHSKRSCDYDNCLIHGETR